jgi:hypothetical protein
MKPYIRVQNEFINLSEVRYARFDKLRINKRVQARVTLSLRNGAAFNYFGDDARQLIEKLYELSACHVGPEPAAVYEGLEDIRIGEAKA